MISYLCIIMCYCAYQLSLSLCGLCSLSAAVKPSKSEYIDSGCLSVCLSVCACLFFHSLLLLYITPLSVEFITTSRRYMLRVRNIRTHMHPRWCCAVCVYVRICIISSHSRNTSSHLNSSTPPGIYFFGLSPLRYDVLADPWPPSTP